MFVIIILFFITSFGNAYIRGLFKLLDLHQLDMDATITIGLTGNGKSTLCNYIIGNKIINKKFMNSPQFYELEKSKEFQSESSFSPIGTELASNTSYPIFLKLGNNTKESVIDMIGFNQNRGYVQQIVSDYYFHYITDSLQSLKILIVIDEMSLRNNKLIPILESLRIKQKFNPSLGLIITKAASNRQQLKQLLREKCKSQQYDRFDELRYIVIMDQFELFRTPENLRLEKLSQSQQRESIIQLINKLQYRHSSEIIKLSKQVPISLKGYMYNIKLKKIKSDIENQMYYLLNETKNQWKQVIYHMMNKKNITKVINQIGLLNQSISTKNLTFDQFLLNLSQIVNFRQNPAFRKIQRWNDFLMYLSNSDIQFLNLGQIFKKNLQKLLLQILKTLKFKGQQKKSYYQEAQKTFENFYQSAKDWFKNFF